VTTKKEKEQARQDALDRLREVLHPGDTVGTIVRHVSKSGMTRDISVVITVDGDLFNATHLVACVLGDRVVNKGVRRGGCGMDMGFDLVYSLSRTLFPDGFDCIGYAERCPSNDHSNDRGMSDYSFTRHHRDGGYALRQRWL
jgi:hypothetical protein